MNNTVKIIIVVLAIGAIAVFVFFQVLPDERLDEISEAVLPDVAVEVLPPPVLEEATTTEEISESKPESTSTPKGPLSPGEAEKQPILPPTPIKSQISPEKKEVELPACERKEYTTKIFSAYKAEPSSLSIYVGDTITFINEDNDLRWPGADPHPTHSSLPLFDALGGISKGQSYSHTFGVEGAYNWHDHLLDDPPSLGTVTVLPCAK